MKFWEVHFDPPDRVKKSISYIPGQACTRFNMCLFCKNIIIMREHLPILVTYQTQLLTHSSTNHQNLPNANFYNDTLQILNNLLDPEQGEFTREDIENAREIAENLDVIIDPAFSRGVGR